MAGASAGSAAHEVTDLAPDAPAGMLMLGARASSSPASGMSREDAVRAQLLELAPRLGLDNTAIETAVIAASHRLPTGGGIVQLEQRVHSVPVFQARASVVVDSHHRVVSVAQRLTRAVLDHVNAASDEPPAFGVSPEAALARLYSLRSAQPLSASAVSMLATDTRAERARFALQTPQGAARVLEATALRVYFPKAGELIPAYHVELLLRDARGRNHGFGAVIDARAAATVLSPEGSTREAQGHSRQPMGPEGPGALSLEASAADAANPPGSGRPEQTPLLWSADLTAHEAFNYRVWAEPDGAHIPTDGPLVDVSPYPGAAPERKRPDFRAQILVSMEGFNHNPQGAADPWLAADASESLGNNVTAYTDRDAYLNRFGFPRLDGYNDGDVRATTNAERSFDYVYDPSRAPDADATQMKASVTQVFYVTNWLHDYWYDSGFDEAAGNAQEDNYGRGGRAGDPLRAEAQDGADSGSANNANMSVLSDGSSPRMQMYVWNGLPVRALDIEPAIAFEDELGAASYGPQTFDASGELVLVNDGSEEASSDSSTPGTVTDGCQSLSGISGRIAVIDRGGCTFVDKIQNAERASASAVVILDNQPGHTAVNPSIENPPDVSVPVLSLSYEDGQKLKAAMQAAGETPVQVARFFRGPEIMRDGTIDNTVVAHEWGHYIHHRLVSCASLTCGGMSEGWGDFIALMLVVHEGDSLDDQVFPLSQYATGGLSQFSAYFGTRRAPYSTALGKNPFTFKHVREAAELPTGIALASTSPEMNEVHNVGEIWASMLFEAYVNVIKAGQAAGRPFAESQRRMADYVVAGMKAAPVEPTFTEQRDAILAAVVAMAQDDATRQADVDAIAQGFAKRGLGEGAIAPPVGSTTLNEAVESFSAAASAARATP